MLTSILCWQELWVNCISKHSLKTEKAFNCYENIPVQVMESNSTVSWAWDSWVMHASSGSRCVGEIVRLSNPVCLFLNAVTGAILKHEFAGTSVCESSDSKYRFTLLYLLFHSKNCMAVWALCYTVLFGPVRNANCLTIITKCSSHTEKTHFPHWSIRIKP